MSDIILSPQQAAAVASDDDAVVVVASAGSGKTEVVARRVERLLEENDDTLGRVLAVSYTVKAAAELHDRLQRRLAGAARRVDTETVHGFAHSLVRQYGTNIGLPSEPELLVRDEDRAELLNSWLEDNGISARDDAMDVLRRVDLARSRLRGDDDVEQWEQALESAGALDYPGLLVAATRLLEMKSVKRQIVRLYDQVIVDEAQNLTAAQYRLLQALIADSEGGLAIPTMLVGDDKQSIVSFAGADPALMQRFADDFHATRFNLSANFRSATAIARAAESIAAQLGHAAQDGEFAAEGEVVVREAANESAEAELVANWVEGLLQDGLDPAILAADEPSAVAAEEIAILARASASLRFVASALRERGIDFVSSSTSGDWLSSLTGQVAMEIVALRTATEHRSTHWQLSRLLGVEPDEVSSVERLAAVLQVHPDPALGSLTPLTLIEDVGDFVAGLEATEFPTEISDEELAAWQADLALLGDTWSRFDSEVERAAVTWGNFRLFCAKQQRGDDLAPGVRLLTIHKAQGREFRAVSIVGLNDGQMPDFRATSHDELTSELRTFYVGVSRARRALLLTRPQSRMTRYGGRRSEPSRFLSLVQS